MRWTKVYALTIALLSVLLVTASFAANVRATGADVYRASKLIGTDVENPQGEKLGDIEDIVLDPDTGRIAYAVLSFGGFLGLGEKHFAVPWAAFTPKAGTTTAVDKFVLNVDKERLKNAPGFEKSNWPNMADRRWAEQVYGFYNVTPHWEQREARMHGSVIEGSQRGAMVTATVQNIDQTSKLLRMKTTNNEIIELQAPAGLLGQLQTGDRVEVVIHKQEAVPPAVQPVPSAR
jgi:sporulation protein YlmC with PRC-barrel domain